MNQTVPLGIYKHYKTGNLYEVLHIAYHSETQEEMVVYKALYSCPNFGQNAIWVRNRAMFCELVNHQDQMISRFKLISDMTSL